MDERSGFPGNPSRRRVLAAAGAVALSAPRAGMAAPPVKALAFDAFPIFDPRSIVKLARELIPNQGEALTSTWLTKLFGYTWLETAGEHYETFATLAESSLVAVAETQHVALSDAARSRLVGAFADLDVWPDVKPALVALKQAGVRLCFLSNLGEAALRANMRRAGIVDHFEAVLSTDRVRRFKPAPAAYAMAMDALGLPKHDIGFVAFGGWDAVGATWFGYRTAWINRLGVPPERLDVRPAVVSRGIEGALQLARGA